MHTMFTPLFGYLMFRHLCCVCDILCDLVNNIVVIKVHILLGLLFEWISGVMATEVTK